MTHYEQWNDELFSEIFQQDADIQKIAELSAVVYGPFRLGSGLQLPYPGCRIQKWLRPIAGAPAEAGDSLARGRPGGVSDLR